MNIKINYIYIALYFICISSTNIFANPIGASQMPVLSEIQYIDSTKWFIEINDAKNLNSRIQSYPCSTESYALQFYNDSIPKVSYPKIWLDSNGIGVISKEKYPEISFRFGSFVVLIHLTTTQIQPTDPSWYISVGSLKPQQSFVGHYATYFGGQIPSRRIVYYKDNTPTIGTPNDTTNIYGTVQGYISDEKGEPIKDIYVVCDKHFRQTLRWRTYTPYRTKTDTSGFYRFDNLLSYLPIALQFVDSLYNPVSSDSIGDFYVEPDSVLRIDATLKDYKPFTFLNKTKKKQSSEIINIREIYVNNSHNQAVITFTSQSGLHEDFIITIYSINGTEIQTLRTLSNGSGTYTVHWDKMVRNGETAAPGIYILKVHQNNIVVKQTFVLP